MSAARNNVSLPLSGDTSLCVPNAIPPRNVCSTVKRPKDPVRPKRVNLLRFTNLAQEILEAENEPILKTEELKENDEDNVGDLERLLKDMNLGTSWLKTPTKTDGNQTKHEPLQSTVVAVNTPNELIDSFSKGVDEEPEIAKPKIQYSTNVKDLFKTPVNSLAGRNTQSVCKSVTKCSAVKSTSNNIINSLNKLPQTHARLKLAPKNSEIGSKEAEVVQKAEPFEEIVVKNVSYIILKQIGSGGSSVVYHCYDKKTKSERAIKKINLGSDIIPPEYIDEVRVLERLQKCDRIVKMYDYELIQSEKVLYVILEKGGLDLAKILKNLSVSNEHLPIHTLLFYWMEMLYAVNQIHENGIIHSDLKPANFLQTGGKLKLIDFGIASCVQNDMTSVVRNRAVGTFNYISPEALTNEASKNPEDTNFGYPKFKVGFKSDVWSLGCILYQLVYRTTPFHHINHMWAKISAIIDPNHKIEYPDIKWAPPKLMNTIKRCLQYNAKARPSVKDLIEEYENIFFCFEPL